MPDYILAANASVLQSLLNPEWAGVSGVPFAFLCMMVDLQPAWRPQYYEWSVCQRHVSPVGANRNWKQPKRTRTKKLSSLHSLHTLYHLFQGCHISDDMEEVVGHMAGVRVRVIRISCAAPLGGKVSYRNQVIQVCIYMIRLSSRTLYTVKLILIHSRI